MKQLEEQIKDDTKRVLRNQTCNTCRYMTTLVPERPLCKRNGHHELPLVHTCYKYEQAPVYVTDQEIRVKVRGNGKCTPFDATLVMK